MHSMPVPGPLALIYQNQRQTPFYRIIAELKMLQFGRHRRPKTRLLQKVPSQSGT